jgi:hypothetical protein
MPVSFAYPCEVRALATFCAFALESWSVNAQCCERVKQCLPAELQDACPYWVQHLQKSGLHPHDNGSVHVFLQDRVSLKPARLVSISHSPRIWADGRQHLRICEPVDIPWPPLSIRTDILVPCVLRLGADSNDAAIAS